VQGRHFKQSLKNRNALAKQAGRSRGDIDILYEFLSSSVGISVMATSNLAWILSRISISVAFETKVKARPLVPKRPARLEGKKCQVDGQRRVNRTYPTRCR